MSINILRHLLKVELGLTESQISDLFMLPDKHFCRNWQYDTEFINSFVSIIVEQIRVNDSIVSYFDLYYNVLHLSQDWNTEF